MKRMKKIVSLALALIMALAMTTTAFAADNNEHVITVTGNKDDKGTHAYEAYQIFAGDLADNPEYRKLTCDQEQGDDHTHTEECYTIDEKAQKYVLSNIVWGSGVDGNALLTALHTSGVNDSKAVTAFKEKYRKDLLDCETAADVAKFISTFASSTENKSEDIDVFATIVSEHLTTDCYLNGNGSDEDPTKIHVNGSGYYFIKDMDASLAGQEDAAYTRFLLQVVGDATVVVKSEVPSGDKKIFYYGKDAYDQGYTYDPTKNENLAEANNAGIGDHVAFQITSKVPNYVGYDYYYFIMNDEMADGLDFDGPKTVSVTIAGVNEELTGGIVKDGVPTPDDADYYVYPEGDHKFRIAFTNIMNYTIGAEIKVVYSATINEDAIIGVQGNENAWSLSYSKDPNVTYGGTVDDKNPGLPLTDRNVVLGKTPDEKTLTYLTQLDIIKYADAVLAENLLAGAEFTLTGESRQVVVNTVKYYTEAANGGWWKLLNGKYTNVAPVLDTYEKIGTGDINTTTGYLYDASRGVYYVPRDVKEYNGKDIFKRVEGTESQYSNPKIQYKEETATKTDLVPSKVSIKLTTGEDGTISFVGLGAGTYTLTETVTPAGYNTIDPITFEISCKTPTAVTTGDEECEWTFTVTDDSEGELEFVAGWGGTAGRFMANVINQSGSLLPSTGGIGTTIFYVVGGILVIGAGILLVAKKRMSNR